MNRREFLQGIGSGAAVMALGGCNQQDPSYAQRTPSRSVASPANNDLEALLGGLHFVMQRNKRYELVTFADLRNLLQSKPTILNFGYGDCTQYCRLSAPVLARFSDRANILTINVRPEHEMAGTPVGQISETDSMHRAMLVAAGVKGPIVLYPADANGNYLSDKQIYDIQKHLGQLIDAKNDPENLPGIIFNSSTIVENGHTEQAVLFDRCGKIKAQAKVTEFTNMDTYIGSQLAAASQVNCPTR